MQEIYQKKITTTFIIIFFLLISFLFVGPIQSNDTWFHLRIGQDILETKSVPKADFHSFTAPGSSYINQNWLGQIILFITYKLSGVLGLQLVHLLLILGTFLLLFFSNKSIPKNFSILTLTLLIPLAVAHDEIRPHTFTWFFSALLVFLIRQKKFYLLPFLFLFWVNIHAGFILGLGAIFFFLLLEFINTKNKSLIIIFLLCCLATLINPSGFNIYLYPLTINESIKLLHIFEWQPFTPQYWLFWVYLSYISILIFNQIKSKNYQKNILQFIFILCFSIFGFTSMRQPIVIAILLYPFFIKSIYSLLPKKNQFILPVISCLGLIIIFFSLGLNYTIIRGIGADSYTLPVYSQKFISQYHITGNILNDYNFGGYFLFTQPNQKVSIDGRVEIYPQQVVQEYIDFTEGKSGWEKIIDKYNIECIIIEPDLKINEALTQNNSSWDIVYFDSISIVYIKKELYPQIPRLKHIIPVGFRTGEVEPSIAEFEYLLKSNPKNYNAYKFLSLLYLQKKDFKTAKHYFDQYIKLFPKGKKLKDIDQFKAIFSFK